MIHHNTHSSWLLLIVAHSPVTNLVGWFMLINSNIEYCVLTWDLGRRAGPLHQGNRTSVRIRLATIEQELSTLESDYLEICGSTLCRRKMLLQAATAVTRHELDCGRCAVGHRVAKGITWIVQLKQLRCLSKGPTGIIIHGFPTKISWSMVDRSTKNINNPWFVRWNHHDWSAFPKQKSWLLVGFPTWESL